jgi:hypothetical protein
VGRRDAEIERRLQSCSRNSFLRTFGVAASRSRVPVSRHRKIFNLGQAPDTLEARLYLVGVDDAPFEDCGTQVPLLAPYG